MRKITLSQPEQTEFQRLKKGMEALKISILISRGVEANAEEINGWHMMTNEGGAFYFVKDDLAEGGGDGPPDG